jgi:hypothetical protein
LGIIPRRSVYLSFILFFFALVPTIIYKLINKLKGNIVRAVVCLCVCVVVWVGAVIIIWWTSKLCIT